MDRFDILLGEYVFCLVNHTGQWSDLYMRLCQLSERFNPGLGFSESEFFDPEVSAYEAAREVYCMLCRRHGITDECCSEHAVSEKGGLMDPDACLREIVSLLGELARGHEDVRADLVEKLRILAQWLEAGGFPPNSAELLKGGSS